MKWILRILMLIHIGFILFGSYCILFMEEYIYSAKYLFVGLTGFFLFLNAFLLIPMNNPQKKVLLVFSLVTYIITVTGFLRPEILKSYWTILLAGSIFIVLNSLFVRIVKTKKNWESWTFPVLSFLVVLPFSFDISAIWLMLVSTCLLVVLTFYLLFKVGKV